jgi:predicted anti-sigma-YlaC factor YlaD
MLSCKEVTARVSESLDRRLSLRERLKVKLHLLICLACQRMVRQMALLRAVSRRYALLDEVAPDPSRETLSHEARQRILQELQAAGHPLRDH